MDNAALAAVLATPGGSFSRHYDEANQPSASSTAAVAATPAAADSEYDWDAIAKASFKRLLEKSKGRDEKLTGRVDDAELGGYVTFDDVADEVCMLDGSEELCRATVKVGMCSFYSDRLRGSKGDGALCVRSRFLTLYSHTLRISVLFHCKFIWAAVYELKKCSNPRLTPQPTCVVHPALTALVFRSFKL